MDKNMKLSISIIIPTIGEARKNELIKTLRSIEENTIKPLEVFLISQGDIDPEALKIFDLNLTLVKIDKKSLTQARNIGIELTKGDIISFLDDDVVLDRNYFEEILKSFDNHKDVKIIQGKITNFQSSKMRSFFWGLFLGPYSLKKSNYIRLFNFENITYKSYSNSEEFCMWAGGANMNIKREVFNYEKFDPQLIRYSCGEDVDFSFRVYKRYGVNSILFQPRAKLIHNASPSGRISNYALILTRRTHKLYFYCKDIGKEKNIGQTMAQIWHDFGRILFYLFKIIKGDYKSGFYYFTALCQTWKHRQDIKNLNIEWMNKELFNEQSVPVAKITETRKL
jgi:glucosyl-dolichyl phosphate glucuronosyltransferase